MSWTKSEMKNLARAHKKKCCVLQPKWGKCAHTDCKRIWALEYAEATEEERKWIWGEDLFGPEAAGGLQSGQAMQNSPKI